MIHFSSDLSPSPSLAAWLIWKPSPSSVDSCLYSVSHFAALFLTHWLTPEFLIFLLDWTFTACKDPVSLAFLHTSFTSATVQSHSPDKDHKPPPWAGRENMGGLSMPLCLMLFFFSSLYCRTFIFLRESLDFIEVLESSKCCFKREVTRISGSLYSPNTRPHVTSSTDRAQLITRNLLPVTETVTQKFYLQWRWFSNLPYKLVHHLLFLNFYLYPSEFSWITMSGIWGWT